MFTTNQDVTEYYREKEGGMVGWLGGVFCCITELCGDSGLRGNFVLSTLGCHTHGRAQQGWALCLQIHLLGLNLSYLNTSTPYTIVEEGLLIHDMKIFQFILKNDDPCAPLGLRNIDLDNNYL